MMGSTSRRRGSHTGGDLAMFGWPYRTVRGSVTHAYRRLCRIDADFRPSDAEIAVFAGTTVSDVRRFRQHRMSLGRRVTRHLSRR